MIYNTEINCSASIIISDSVNCYGCSTDIAVVAVSKCIISSLVQIAAIQPYRYRRTNIISGVCLINDCTYRSIWNIVRIGIIRDLQRQALLLSRRSRLSQDCVHTDQKSVSHGCQVLPLPAMKSTAPREHMIMDTRRLRLQKMVRCSLIQGQNSPKELIITRSAAMLL